MACIIKNNSKYPGYVNDIALQLEAGLPQIQDFEIPDFFKTFSGPEIIFLSPPMTGIL